MFQLTDKPIHPPVLDSKGSGGFVTFEGRVRNHAGGKEVAGLQYETFPEMAIAEGEQLIVEAIERYGLQDARIVHRIGNLSVGESAVWIGVAAPHRRDAFAACEWLIDELKHRVPIWKREIYEDGDSGWIGIKAPMPKDVTDLERYDRQMRLQEIGTAGQLRLAQARVLLVGVGGLGAGSLPHLAGAGIGSIGLIDPDRIEASNLGRQVIYRASEVGRSKVERAAAFAKSLNPDIGIDAFPEAITQSNVDRFVSEYDLVIDGTDSLATKFLLNASCRRHGKPLITASVHKFEGHLMAVSPEGPCLNCLFPETPADGCVGTCAQEGILGVVPGMFGVLQASLAIQLLLGFGEALTESLFLFDLKSYEMQMIKRTRREGCLGCRGELANSPLEVESLEEGLRRFGSYALIDIRELDEEPALTVDHLRMPGSSFKWQDDLAPAILVCSSGVRSLQLAQRLAEEGESRAVSLRGGLLSLNHVHVESV